MSKQALSFPQRLYGDEADVLDHAIKWDSACCSWEVSSASLLLHPYQSEADALHTDPTNHSQSVPALQPRFTCHPIRVSVLAYRLSHSAENARIHNNGLRVTLLVLFPANLQIQVISESKQTILVLLHLFPAGWQKAVKQTITGSFNQQWPLRDEFHFSSELKRNTFGSTGNNCKFAPLGVYRESYVRKDAECL